MTMIGTGGALLAHVYFFGCKLLKLRGRFLRLVTT